MDKLNINDLSICFGKITPETVALKSEDLVSSINDCLDNLSSDLAHKADELSTSFYKTDDITKLDDYASYRNGSIAVVKTYIAGTSYQYIVQSADTSTSTIQIITLSSQDSVLQDAVSVWLSSDGSLIKKLDAPENRKIQYTAYRFNTNLSTCLSTWQALDGNYSADNVIMVDNLTATSTIGRYSPVGGSIVIPCKGKTLQWTLDDIVSITKDDATIVQPNVTASITNNKTYEVGTRVNPKFKVTFTNGSYTYGSLNKSGMWSSGTGVVLATNGLSADTTDGDKTSLVSGTEYTSSKTLSVEETSFFYVTPYASWLSGDTVANNKHAASTTKTPIKQGNKTGTKVTFNIGFRGYFYGCLTTSVSMSDLTSKIIRDLNSDDGQTAFPVNNTSFLIPNGTKQILFAAPHGKFNKKFRPKDMAGDYTGFDADRQDNICSVEGKNNYTGTMYDIWSYVPPSQFTVDTTVKINWE